MKNIFRPLLIVFSATTLLAMFVVYEVCAAGPKVSAVGNKHNLSNANTDLSVKYKASGDANTNPRGSQVCIFCHTPHSANVAGGAPLWNRNFSSENFQRYSSGTLKIRSITDAKYSDGAKPNGSTKLCLSCHDGVSNMGAVYKGLAIDMVGGVITGVIDIDSRASFNPSYNKMKSGHHPVSFVYTQAIADAINLAKGQVANTYKIPAPPGVNNVKLDKEFRMQCTTCHDAHQNQSFDDQCYPSSLVCNATDKIKVAPFWVLGGGSNAANDQQTVCTTCHPMNAGYTYYDATKSWQTPP
jgi:hypothetical protein